MNPKPIITIIEPNDDHQEQYRLALRDAFDVAQTSAEIALAPGSQVVLVGAGISLDGLREIHDRYPEIYVVAIGVDQVERADKWIVADEALVIEEATFAQLRERAPGIAARALAATSP